MVDPSLAAQHIDEILTPTWDTIVLVFFKIVVLSFFLERCLAVAFEYRHFVSIFQSHGVKEIIALALSYYVCHTWEFDAISGILGPPVRTNAVHVAYALTAMIIAGGSKASVKLFSEVLNVKSSAIKEFENKEKAEKK